MFGNDFAPLIAGAQSPWVNGEVCNAKLGWRPPFFEDNAKGHPTWPVCLLRDAACDMQVPEALAPCVGPLQQCLAPLGFQVLEKSRASGLPGPSDAGGQEDDSPQQKTRKKAEPKRAAISAETDVAHGDEDHVITVTEKTDAQRARLLEACMNSTLFSGMEQHDLDTVVNCMFERKCGPGEMVIVQDEPGDNFYVVDTGEYAVILKSKGPSPVHFYKGGDTFGELALMYNTPRAATIQCISGGVVWGLDRVTFRKLMMNVQKKAAAVTAQVSSSGDSAIQSPACCCACHPSRARHASATRAPRERTAHDARHMRTR